MVPGSLHLKDMNARWFFCKGNAGCNCKEFQDQSSESLDGGAIIRLRFAFSLDGARHFLHERGMLDFSALRLRSEGIVFVRARYKYVWCANG